MKTFFEKFSYFFQSVAVTLIAALFVTSVVYAATTIGANINTGGNLDVDGTASTTNATTTGYLYVGVGITNPTGFDFSIGDLLVSDDVYFNSQATTSVSLWVGSAGTTNNISMTGGDLYVQDAIEADGDLFVNGGTLSLATGTPTTTAGLFVGPIGITSTTTIGIGAQGQNGCIELTRGGRYMRIYPGADMASLITEEGRCN